MSQPGWKPVSEERILIIDGAMGTMIQGYKLGESDYRGERFCELAYRHQGQQRPAGAEPSRRHSRITTSTAPPVPTSSRPTPSTPPASPWPTTRWKRSRPRSTGRRPAWPAPWRTSGRPGSGETALCCRGAGPHQPHRLHLAGRERSGKRNVTYDELVAAYTESTHALIEGADLI